jgi:maleamate amidohydrolase
MPVWDPYLSAEEWARVGQEWGRRQEPGTRPALLVVDMTRAFADRRYPLSCPDPGPCIDAVRRLLGAARRLGLPVVYSAGLPARNPAERGLWKSSGRPPAPGLPDPNQIVPELEPLAGESVVRKRRPSAFFGTELASLLVHHGVDTVIVTGMVTSGCVRATVVDAFSHNLKVVVPEEAVADRIAASHAIALLDIQLKYGEVWPLAEVLGWLEALGRGTTAPSGAVGAR